jgi:hypothetical protein
MFSGGTGTQADPYLIATAEDLNNVRYEVNSYFKQVADIDLSEYENWEPIEGDVNYFRGSYDGQNYKIINMNIDVTHDDVRNVGLFSRLDFAGDIVNGHGIRNCNIYGNIKAIYNDETPSSSEPSCYGGLTGTAVTYNRYDSEISNCHSYVNIDINGKSIIGGLIGRCITTRYNSEVYTLNNCSSEGEIVVNLTDPPAGFRTATVGGLIGEFMPSNYTYPPVTNKAYIKNSYSNVNIKYNKTGYHNAPSNIGGFIGLIGKQADSRFEFCVDSCFCKTNIEVLIDDYYGNLPRVSGFCGYILGKNKIISNSFVITEMIGEFSSRGFLISSESYAVYVENCYSVMSHDAIRPRSPFAGNSIITSCYYDYTLCPYLDAHAIPKTTFEMKQQSTFEDWDFDTIWGIDPSINDGYPYLKWQSLQPSDSNVYVKTSPTTIKKAIKMVTIDTPTTVKEIKKLNVITDTGLK